MQQQQQPRERILVAMSGGVDSSVAAAWLVERGYDVVGVTLHLWDYPEDATSARNRCCAAEDQHDARRVADHLGIAHYAFDRRELFRREVVDPFVDAYLAGSTPSPCTTCNRAVKMAELFSLADRLGARKVATGHYARIVWRSHRAELHRGSDRTKDQSYFLSGLSPAQLARLEFPLGSSTKAEVRADALARRLPGAGKGESQELCFVPRGRYDAFIEERAAGRLRPGPIVDADGQVVGQHAGVHRFTLGQRKGLGVALGKPGFVAALDAASATVRLGRGADLLHRGARLRDSRFFDDVRLPVRAEVQVRYRQQAVPATIDLDERGVRVEFDEPVRAVAHGQALVAYHGERVLGGGTIDSALGNRVVKLAVRLLSLVAAVVPASCGLGDGEGQIEADDLFVEDCWSGPFRLDPDFFAAQPYRDKVSLRIQHGSDTEEVSDGSIVLVDDVNRVRKAIADQGGSATFRVALPPAVVPPGYPVVADPDPAIVHLTLYLHRACHAQNGALYSVAGDITFRSLFNGNLNETDDAQRLTDAFFSDITVADPRDRMPGTNILFHETHIRGSLRFYFHRGQPAQPFP